MDRLFPAIEERFKADAELKQIGRRIWLGTGGDTDPPYVIAELVSTEDFDAFDADITVYMVQFRIVTGGTHEGKHYQLVRAFKRVFDDAALASGFFTCAGCRRTGMSGPNRTDDGMQWESLLDYEITIQAATLVPAERGA